MVSIIEYQLSSIMIWIISAYFLSVLAVLLAVARCLKDGRWGFQNLLVAVVSVIILIIVSVGPVGFVWASLSAGTSLSVVISELFAMVYKKSYKEARVASELESEV